MDKKQIPPALMLQWERDAISQNIPHYEFVEFLRMKQEIYWQSLEDAKERPQIFANAARNKLTEYGNEVALKSILQIPVVERTCKLASFKLEDLQKRLQKGFADDEQRRNFVQDREHWFMHLKERMKDLRISKETLESFGLSWKSCKTFAYQVV